MMLQIHFLLESTAVSYGGTGLAAQELAQALSRSQAIVFVHVLRDEQPAWLKDLKSSVQWRVVPQGFWSKAVYLWRLGGQANAMVHLHGIWNPWWSFAAQLLTWRRVPFAVSPHGSLESNALVIKRWKKRLALTLYQRRSLKQACAIVVTSGKEADGVAALELGVPIRLVPNGVKLSPIQPDLDPSFQFDVQQQAHPRAFIFVSRIHPSKDCPCWCVRGPVCVSPAGAWWWQAMTSKGIWQTFNP